MKKIVITFLVIIACVIEIYFSYNYNRLDPNIKSIEDMQVMKMKPESILLLDKVYLEKNKDKISSILNALKNRSKENNTERINSYNYTMDMRIKDKKRGGFLNVRYAVWIEDDGVFITMPDISDQSYKLQTDSAKLIQKYLAKINYTEP